MHALQRHSALILKNVQVELLLLTIKKAAHHATDTSNTAGMA
jgi:hypothetical protein